MTWTVRNEMPQKGIYAGEPTEAMVDITVISVVEYYMAFKMIGDTTVCMSSWTVALYQYSSLQGAHTLVTEINATS